MSAVLHVLAHIIVALAIAAAVVLGASWLVITGRRVRANGKRIRGPAATSPRPRRRNMLTLGDLSPDDDPWPAVKGMLPDCAHEVPPSRDPLVVDHPANPQRGDEAR